MSEASSVANEKPSLDNLFVPALTECSNSVKEVLVLCLCSLFSC